MATTHPTDDWPIGSGRIGPDDPRYLAVVDKRFNKRFSARPDYVRLVSSTDHVVSAVEEGVRGGRRLVVTGGGHCLEGFVSDPDLQGGLELERHRSPILPATRQEPRDLVRAKQ